MKKSISVFSLIMINIIAIDSLRNLPINAANAYAMPFYYLIACFLFLIPCALVTAQLATHYPETGGAYVWICEAFGKRMGFIAIWLQWIYNVCWYPTILAFVAANIAYLIDPHLTENKIYMVSMIIGLFGVATLLNSFGMKTSANVSIISAVLGTIIPMLTLIGLGCAWIMQHKPLALDPVLSHWFPMAWNTPHLPFFLVVMFSVFGLEMSASHAGVVKNPEKNYPKALLISSAFIVLSLILSSLSIALVVPHEKLSLVSGLDQAFAAFLNAEHLPAYLPWIIIAIIIGSFGSIAAWVIGPTKGLVLAAQNSGLPRWLHYQNRLHSPIGILILQAVLVLCLCGFFVFIPSFNASYWILSDLTAQLAVLFYLIFFGAAIRLHYKMPHKPHAFRLKKSALYFACTMGWCTCLTALVLGFIPTASITSSMSVCQYEMILLTGITFAIVIPLLLTRRRRIQCDKYKIEK